MTASDPPHGWDAARVQWNAGANDGFIRAHQAAFPGEIDPMQYLTRAQQPVSWALADAYTTCDRWFASVMGPTLPNRAYWHTATSFGLNVNNDVLTTFSAGVPVPSIYNRLVDQGVDWAYYFGNLGVASLLGNPGPHQLDLGPNDGTGHIRRFGDALTGAASSSATPPPARCPRSRTSTRRSSRTTTTRRSTRSSGRSCWPRSTPRLRPRRSGRTACWW